MITAHEIAQTFNLKKRGREYRGDCPFCQARKMELAVWDKPEGIGCCCYYGGCDSRELFRVLVQRENVYLPTPPSNDTATQAERNQWALRIWDETVSAKDSLAEQYIRNRGITLALPADLRFHSGLKHSPTGQIFPALVAAVRDVQGNVKGIHRTYLDLDGRKASVDMPKMTLGPIQGCAIHLTKPTETLGICEGIETALSVQQLSGIPVWSAISAGNMKRLYLPECVTEVIIFGDNGLPGMKAANEAAALFQQEGKSVRIAFPQNTYGDFNDLLAGGQYINECQC